MEWISLDKLPPHTGAYLITDGRMIGEGYWSPANGWEIDRDSRLCGFMDVQFWTHFPELPKERNNDWNRELSLSDGITVTERLPGTPVQYVGQCNGQWYYFRARHQHAIASNAEAATGATSSMVDRGLDREVGQQSPIQTTDALCSFTLTVFTAPNRTRPAICPWNRPRKLSGVACDCGALRRLSKNKAYV